MNLDDILSTSIDIIASNGYDELSLGAVSKSLNVQKSSLYYYFKSKDELISLLYEKCKLLLSKYTFSIDFNQSSYEILSSTFKHWERLYNDDDVSKYLSMIEQRRSIDEIAYDISLSLDLMIKAQSEAVIENLVIRKKIFSNDIKTLSLLFSSTCKYLLERSESGEAFINSFINLFSH